LTTSGNVSPVNATGGLALVAIVLADHLLRQKAIT